ncbi:MAG: MGMT family protein [Christensenellales bacterium]
MQQSFAIAVYKLVQTIPCGMVATYGQIAMLLDHPHCARGVGQALHQAPDDEKLPCHRVVNHAGRTAPHFARQKELLLAEGVSFLENGCVDLSKHLFIPSADQI